MGGCRCTYRNCQATTGSGVHFFHFPVFEKVRCHQWITNARRYDLLDLTLSQLKNRVVCQEHFRDEMFMNYKKNRLTYSAIPTEDGPVTSENVPPGHLKFDETNAEMDYQSPIEISEVAAKDDTKFYTTREKAATLSVPYKNFLENSNLDKLNDPDLLQSLWSPKSKTARCLVKSPIRASNKAPIWAPIRAPKRIPNKAQKIKMIKKNPPSVKVELTDPTGKKNKSEENVVILSAEKVTSLPPIKPPPALKTVSPSFVIEKPKKQPQPHASSSVSGQEKMNGLAGCMDYMLLPEQVGSTLPASVPLQSLPAQPPPPLTSFSPKIISVATGQVNQIQCILHPPTLPIEYVAADLPENTIDSENVTESSKTNHSLHSGCHKRSTNIKVSAAKQAEIDKKRKFNRSITEAVGRTLQTDNSPETRAVSAISVCSAPNMPNRIQTAQNVLSDVGSTLMSTVEENRRDIAEIKRILLGQHLPSVAQPTLNVNQCTQTDWSNENKKKYIYREISKYLSESLKSSVYEELFPNTIPLAKRFKIQKVGDFPE